MKNFVIIIVAVLAFIGFYAANKEADNMQKLKITSSAFEAGGKIPPKYTCDGENINPPLMIENIPKEVKILVLIMDDPDAPAGVWDHWVKWNIAVVAETMEFSENLEPDGISGKGTSGNLSYRGPCPPDREHRYFFKVYALDSELALPEGASKKEVEEAMKSRVIASGELMGRYERQGTQN